MKRGIVAAITALLVAVASASNSWAEATWIDPSTATQAIAHGGDLVVLDARSSREYAAGHIAGALNAPWQSFSDMAGKPGNARWGILLPADKLSTAISALGIGNSTRVLVYSSSPNGWGEDGRVAWTLRSAGVTNVAIVDGGYKGWVAAGGRVSQARATRQPTNFRVASVDSALNATKDEVKSALGRAHIVDARAADEYAGAQKFGELRGGHLPHAISLPWDKVFDRNGRMRDSNALRKIMVDAGLKPDDDIIIYCTKGIRSAHLALVLREISFGKTRNYDASFYEWSGDTALPVEK